VGLGGSVDLSMPLGLIGGRPFKSFPVYVLSSAYPV
jgi:hypothetical protein